MFGSSLPPVVGGHIPVSYLRYFCLFAHSGVQHILCCVFVLFFFVLCTLCYQFLWIVLFLIAHSIFSDVYFRATVRSNQRNGIRCFSDKLTALRSKSKDWLARNQDNVSGATCLPTDYCFTIQIQLSVLA